MYLPDDILTKVDRMSMAHGLEARVSLLDHRIVEFAASVPFHLKLSQGISKRVAKHALRDLLPPALLKQRKRGFSIPIHRWFRESLMEHSRALLLSPDSVCHNYLRRASIENLISEHVSGTADRGHHLWALLVLEHWIRGTKLATRQFQIAP
jgi:asparagine synthase (glutamine-hydrolysing)